MHVNKINNTVFKQTFMPSYNRYTDIQKEIGDDIKVKTKALESSLAEDALRPDLLITRCGKTDSLHVFLCCRNYDYKWVQENYDNKLFVGKYDKNRPFRIEDIAKAKSKTTVNTLKAIAITLRETTKKILKNLI